ncbi:hypothetical protein V8G54_022630 [Vigna mungo]|uniref:Uncharacterized protein n=1 Tax=Vigna mungo TaxID=3915 RepID=A0AAQ3RNG3_VIGMU
MASGMCCKIFFQRVLVAVEISTSNKQKLFWGGDSGNFHNDIVVFATLDGDIGQNSITICRFQNPSVHSFLFSTSNTVQSSISTQEFQKEDGKLTTAFHIEGTSKSPLISDSKRFTRSSW